MSRKSLRNILVGYLVLDFANDTVVLYDKKYPSRLLETQRLHPAIKVTSTLLNLAIIGALINSVLKLA